MSRSSGAVGPSLSPRILPQSFGRSLEQLVETLGEPRLFTVRPPQQLVPLAYLRPCLPKQGHCPERCRRAFGRLHPANPPQPRHPLLRLLSRTRLGQQSLQLQGRKRLRRDPQTVVLHLTRLIERLKIGRRGRKRRSRNRAGKPEKHTPSRKNTALTHGLHTRVNASPRSRAR